MFDLLTYARQLFMQANPSASESDFSVTIRERTLSDSMDSAEWADQKFKWKTTDSSERQAGYPEDASKDEVVALQP